MSTSRASAAAAAALLGLASALLVPAHLPDAGAQEFGGGVDKEGSWYSGEGLKRGDYFYYVICHVDHNDCADFEMELWVEGDVRTGTETKWLVQAVVYDGGRVYKGNMELGKIAPEPTGGTPNIASHRGVFKTSLVWLSSFATAHHGAGQEGPKEFSRPSWGKIANIGGEQVRPLELDTVSTRAGEFDAVVISWKTGGAISKIWVVDGFPFPVKASTWTHVSEGVPPQEYRFELLDYEEGVSEDPFLDIEDTSEEREVLGCQKNYDLVKVRKATANHDYLVDLKYGPENPASGCDMELIINFHNKFDETEFLHQLQYDILVLDGDGRQVRSVAGEDARRFLFSSSGQVRTFVTVEEDPGTAHYALVIYGVSPEHIVPSSAPDSLLFDVEVAPGAAPAPAPAGPEPIPGWIKTAAGYWVDGATSDAEFVSAIEYLIGRGLIAVPAGDGQGGGGGISIPGWVKTTTGFWADGLTADSEFVSALQYLIRAGVMSVG